MHQISAPVKTPTRGRGGVGGLREIVQMISPNSEQGRGNKIGRKVDKGRESESTKSPKTEHQHRRCSKETPREEGARERRRENGLEKIEAKLGLVRART